MIKAIILLRFNFILNKLLDNSIETSFSYDVYD